MNRTLAVAATATLILAGTASFAASEVSKASAQDGLFVRDASQGNMTEIETSRMVEDRSKDPELNAFAKKMIEDHKTLDGKLKTAAGDADVYMMSDFDKGHQMEVDMLKNASDADFPKLYLEIQDKEHGDAVYAFKAESDMGLNPAIRQAAVEGLPIVTQHQQMVVDLEKKMGVAAGTMASMADGEKKPLSK